MYRNRRGFVDLLVDGKLCVHRGKLLQFLSSGGGHSLAARYRRMTVSMCSCRAESVML